MNGRTRKEDLMNVAWWVGFLGAGVVLGSCSGYSSLGEVPAVAGDNGDGEAMGGSQSMGAKGGRQGKGGTGMGTGGYAGTGMGTGMGTGGYAGTGMGTGGYAGTGMGTGGYAGTGMGTGGSVDPPVRCMVAEDCPNGHSCDMCADGSVACAESFCADGTCGITPPTCPETPCAHRAFCDPCMAPDGVPGFCDATGVCGSYPLACDTPDVCPMDGDCPRDAVCLLCSDGTCADGGCIDGYCGSVCPTEYTCMTPMDCPKMLSDDPCTTGPWLCVKGSCSREYQGCMTPEQ
jgi:hypothetical protein